MVYFASREELLLLFEFPPNPNFLRSAADVIPTILSCFTEPTFLDNPFPPSPLLFVDFCVPFPLILLPPPDGELSSLSDEQQNTLY